MAEIKQESRGGVRARLYTKSDVARLLSVSTRTVERMDGRRQIPGRTELPGGAIRWYVPAVDTWVEAMAGVDAGAKGCA